MDCYIWSSSNQWEGFTAPSGSFLHSVKVPGWGIWYYSQDLSTPVLLDETTGNWGTGFPTQWSNQRNISSSCVVQISATQTATIGDVRFHFLKFMYSEKTTKFFEIFTLLLTTVQSKVKILQNFVAFSEYMNDHAFFIVVVFEKIELSCC